MEFPELPQKGKEEAELVIHAFKERITKAASEAISTLYCDMMPHIETDSWTNYREALRAAMKRQLVAEETATSDDYWAQDIREAIYTQFKEQLQNSRIRELEAQVDDLRADLCRKDWR